MYLHTPSRSRISKVRVLHTDRHTTDRQTEIAYDWKYNITTSPHSRVTKYSIDDASRKKLDEEKRDV